MLENLIKKLRKEKDYYYSWQASIAMNFKDEWYRTRKAKCGNYINQQDVHEIANQAAKNFLDQLAKKLKGRNYERN